VIVVVLFSSSGGPVVLYIVCHNHASDVCMVSYPQGWKVNHIFNSLVTVVIYYNQIMQSKSQGKKIIYISKF